MTDDDCPRCPRCASHDLTVVMIENYPHGSRVVLTCDACSCRHQSWRAKPLGAST